MGHGKSNCLYGAKGDYYGTLENELVKSEEPDKYFYEDNFINELNLFVMKFFVLLISVVFSLQLSAQFPEFKFHKIVIYLSKI